MVAGYMIAGEAELGTLRIVLLRPTRRGAFVLAKWTMAMVYLAVGFAVMLAGGLLFGGIFFGLHPMITLSGSTVGVWHGLGLILLSCLYALAAMSCIVSMALLFSTLTDSSLTALIATIVIYIVITVLIQFSYFDWLRPWVFPQYLLEFTNFFRDPIYWRPILKGLGVFAPGAAGSRLPRTWSSGARTCCRRVGAMPGQIPETMRAMQLAAPAPAAEAPLRLVELPVPEPGPGQVLLAGAGLRRLPHRPAHPGGRAAAAPLARRARPPDRRRGRGARARRRAGRAGRRAGRAAARRRRPRRRAVAAPDRRDLPLLPPRAGEPLRARALHRLGRRRRLRRVRGGAGRVRLPSPGRHDGDGGSSAALRRHHRLPLPAAGGHRRRRRRAAGSRQLAARPGSLRPPARPTGRRRGPPAAPKRLAIYGFGSAASLCTQVAIWRGWEVYGIARDEEHRAMARELGAVWAGEASDDPGVLYDAAIVFAPAGELAVDALRRLDKGGVVALGGIYSSPIPPIEYPWIYHERVVRSVANSTRQDARELLRDAAPIPIVSRVQEYALEQANEALLDLKEDRVRGSAVLRVAED